MSKCAKIEQIFDYTVFDSSFDSAICCQSKKWRLDVKYYTVWLKKNATAAISRELVEIERRKKYR